MPRGRFSPRLAIISHPAEAGRNATSGVQRPRVGRNVDRVLPEDIQRDDLECSLVRCGEDNIRGHSRLVCAQPVMSGHAPPVSGLEPLELELGNRGDEVVADRLLMIEELGAHYGTDRVAAEVSWPGAAGSLAVEPGQRIGAAVLHRAA